MAVCKLGGAAAWEPCGGAAPSLELCATAVGGPAPTTSRQVRAVCRESAPRRGRRRAAARRPPDRAARSAGGARRYPEPRAAQRLNAAPRRRFALLWLRAQGRDKQRYTEDGARLVAG